MEFELRYRLKQDEDELWYVFDSEMDAPAQIPGGSTSIRLEELSQSEAIAWWKVLNSIFGKTQH